MDKVGNMPAPEDFPYEQVMRRGRPRHKRFDSFWMKHPTMDIGHRAKIFSPYDALKGFSDVVSAKEVPYVDRVELSTEDQLELDRRLHILQELTANSRLARENHVEVAATYYEPCADRNNFAYGIQGRYITCTGLVKKVDVLEKRVLVLEERSICIDDLLSVAGAVFGDTPEEE